MHSIDYIRGHPAADTQFASGKLWRLPIAQAWIMQAGPGQINANWR